MQQILKDWGTLLIAVYGAVAATLSLTINWLNRRDTRREVKRTHLAVSPWATLAVTNGDADGRMLKATFWNPSEHEIDIETVEVLRPSGWQVVPWRPGLGEVHFADIADAGRRIALPLRIGRHPDDPNKHVLGQTLIIATPSWRTENMATWPGGVKHVAEVPVTVVFRGRTRSAGREPVEIPATA